MVHASPMRSKFVSDRAAIPRHSSSFHSCVFFLFAILQMMSPSAHRIFRGFFDGRSLSNYSANNQSAGTTIVGMMDIFSNRSPNSKALTGGSYWPSLATCSMCPLSTSRGERKPLILPYCRNLYNAPAYAFLVPSSSFRYTVASYELPTSCSTSSNKAPSAFWIRTACLSRLHVPCNDPPPPGRGGLLGHLNGSRTRHSGKPTSGCHRTCMVGRVDWCSHATSPCWCERAVGR